MRKIAIVGFAARSMKTDWPQDVEIWTINCAWRYGFTRIDRLFEMHQIEQLTSYLGRETEWENQHWQWLQQITDYPVYMIKHDERIPRSVEYPLEEINADVFSHLWRDAEREVYITSSASFMMAMAIHECQAGDTIFLNGFEMATGSEYTYQRDGMTYMIGLANGRGINVVLPQSSGIMRAKIYAYEGGQTVDRDLISNHAIDYTTQRQAADQAYREAMEAKKHEQSAGAFRTIFRADGAIQSLTHLLSLSDGQFFGRQTLEAHLKSYEMQHSENMGFFNKFNGQLDKIEQDVKAKPTTANKKKLEEERIKCEKAFRTMLLCEGAIQAFQNLIAECDLQIPSLAIRDVTRFVEEKKE